jgi:carbon storage regulator
MEATAMLVLSRKVGERVLIGEEISITVVRVANGGVRLGIIAPPEFAIMREELALPDEAEPQMNAEQRR